MVKSRDLEEAALQRFVLNNFTTRSYFNLSTCDYLHCYLASLNNQSDILYGAQLRLSASDEPSFLRLTVHLFVSGDANLCGYVLYCTELVPGYSTRIK